MNSTAKPNEDLVLVRQGDAGSAAVWESTGTDPNFEIRLPLLRKRYLIIRLTGDVELDPAIYLNFGWGFDEQRRLDPARGKDHLIVLDVGTVGTLRSVRLDPSTFLTRFSISFEKVSTLAAVEKRAAELNAGAPDLRRSTFGDFSRFIGKSPFWRRRKRNPTGPYARDLYKLAQDAAQRIVYDGADPWLSIVVPTYNTRPDYLDDLLGSYASQDIAGTELIFSDDGSTSTATLDWLDRHRETPSVRVINNKGNAGIALCTNAGLADARGTWVTLLDHDDLLAPCALKMIRMSLDEHPQANFLFTDELLVNDRLKPSGFLLKPAYDPVLLSGVNYINHFSVYRRERLLSVGGLRAGYEGSQDYDLLLRYLSDLPEETILHLPYPAYWWRRTGDTYSARHLDRATSSARKSLMEHFGAKGHSVVLSPAITPSLHKVDFSSAPAGQPRISVIIPNKDSYDLIRRVLADVLDKTDYKNLEVIVIDNGTTDGRVLDLYAQRAGRHANFHAHVDPEPFNFARSINKGFARASGEHFLLLNNDVEVIEPGWLNEMVSCLSYDTVGIVGAKLLYGNGTVQHAGVIVGYAGLAGHWYVGVSRDFGGPMNRLHVRSSMTCVTGAVMLISGQCKAAVGELDETNFAVAYNDVDYCIRAYRLGFRAVWTPFATLYHHESVSRGSDELQANKARFEREKANLKRIDATETFEDPTLNPHYGRQHSVPGLQSTARLYAARPWFL